MKQKQPGFIPSSLVNENKPEDMTDIEISRFVFQFTLFGLVGSIFLYAFSLYSWFNQRPDIALALFIFGIASTVITIYVNRTRQFALSVWAGTVVIFLLSLYLVATGGVNQTGPLWVYPLFILTLYIQGHRNGLIIGLALLAVLTILLYVPLEAVQVADYESSFKGRFLTSSLAILLMSWILELSRSRAFMALTQYHRELEEVSRTDYLTGALNRRAMMERLNEEVSRYNRNGDVFSVLLIDIDNFKQVNDEYGHTIGDCVLKKLSAIMKEQLREHDSVSRWGGEEFLVLLPSTVLEQGHYVAEMLRQHVKEYRFDCANGSDLQITLSIGVSSSEYTSDALDYVDQADARLYQAKRTGRNRVISKDLKEPN